MFVYTQPGFKHAPISKFLIYNQVLIPIIISLLDVRYLFDLQIMPHLLVWHQWWRIPINQLLFVSQSQVLVGILFLYNMRIIERQFGSRKYLSYMILMYILSLLLVPVLTLVLAKLPLISSLLSLSPATYIAPGPTSVIFSLLVLYKELIPSIYKFQITPVASPFTMLLSDKIFVYVCAADILLLGFPSAFIPASIGWVLGYLVHFEVIPGKNWRIPSFLMFKSKSRRQQQSPRPTSSASSQSSLRRQSTANSISSSHSTSSLT